jgi:enoyl-CoA hydratase/carnithine racemase
VITGEGKAFAAGADIKMMSSMKFSDVFKANLFASTDVMRKLQTPTIAAVNGFAFGGGCELAMLCDMIIASDKAMFGQPEIKVCSTSKALIPIPFYLSLELFLEWVAPSVCLLPLARAKQWNGF